MPSHTITCELTIFTPEEHKQPKVRFALANDDYSLFHNYPRSLKPHHQLIVKEILELSTHEKANLYQSVTQELYLTH